MYPTVRITPGPIAIGAFLVLLLALMAGCEGPFQPHEAGPERESIPPTLDLEAPALQAGSLVLEAVEGLTIYDSRAEFDVAAPGLPLEDFEGANTETFLGCPGPFNSETDNGCFSPGAILEGISIQALINDQMGVLRPPIAGVTKTAIGTAWWADTPEISFPEGDVSAVGLELLAPQGGPAPVTVQLFASDGSQIGSLNAQTGIFEGVFWGVISPVPISRIEILSHEDVGLLFTHIAFGTVEASSSVEVLVEVQQGSINPISRGVIPVAVLSTVDFDATTIDPATVRFGPNGANPISAAGRVEDVDGDGLPDLLFHFPTSDTGLACGDTEAALEGETVDGRAVGGMAVVRILCRPDPSEMPPSREPRGRG